MGVLHQRIEHLQYVDISAPKANQNEDKFPFSMLCLLYPICAEVNMLAIVEELLL